MSGQTLRRIRLDMMFPPSICGFSRRPISPGPADFTNWPRDLAGLPDGRPVRTEADLWEWERLAMRKPAILP